MRFTLTTAAGAETVFDEVADFGIIDRWDPFVRRSDLTEGERMEEGAVYSLDTVIGLSLRYRIAKVERPRLVVYQGGTNRARSTDTIEVDETAAGARISVSSEIRFSGWMTLVGPVIYFLVWAGGRFVSLPSMRRHLRELSP